MEGVNIDPDINIVEGYWPLSSLKNLQAINMGSFYLILRTQVAKMTRINKVSNEQKTNVLKNFK